MFDFDSIAVNVSKDFLKRIAAAESKEYREIILTTPSGTNMVTNIDKFYNGGIPVNNTFCFLVDPNPPYSRLNCDKPLEEVPTKAQELKGKRLKKGTVVEKPFYQKQNRSSRF